MLQRVVPGPLGRNFPYSMPLSLPTNIEPFSSSAPHPNISSEPTTGHIQQPVTELTALRAEFDASKEVSLGLACSNARLNGSVTSVDYDRKSTSADRIAEAELVVYRDVCTTSLLVTPKGLPRTDRGDHSRDDEVRVQVVVCIGARRVLAPTTAHFRRIAGARCLTLIRRIALESVLEKIVAC